MDIEGIRDAHLTSADDLWRYYVVGLADFKYEHEVGYLHADSLTSKLDEALKKTGSKDYAQLQDGFTHKEVKTLLEYILRERALTIAKCAMEAGPIPFSAQNILEFEDRNALTPEIRQNRTWQRSEFERGAPKAQLDGKFYQRTRAHLEDAGFKPPKKPFWGDGPTKTPEEEAILAIQKAEIDIEAERNKLAPLIDRLWEAHGLAYLHLSGKENVFPFAQEPANDSPRAPFTDLINEGARPIDPTHIKASRLGGTTGPERR